MHLPTMVVLIVNGMPTRCTERDSAHNWEHKGRERFLICGTLALPQQGMGSKYNLAPDALTVLKIRCYITLQSETTGARIPAGARATGKSRLARSPVYASSWNITYMLFPQLCVRQSEGS